MAITLKTNEGLNNSQSYRTIEQTLREIDFNKRLADICSTSNREYADIDLSNFLSYVVTHYRNRRMQDFGESFFSL